MSNKKNGESLEKSLWKAADKLRKNIKQKTEEI